VKKDIITVNDLSPAEIDHIFDLADRSENLTFPRQTGLTACVSFEGNSIRTRATFTKALVDLDITPVEVPNLLKTGEAVGHLADYMDNWMDLYILRDRDHERMAAFAASSASIFGLTQIVWFAWLGIVLPRPATDEAAEVVTPAFE